MTPTGARSPVVRLERLAIRGFKSIAELELDALPQTGVLIGPNGAGKSNLLGALRLVGRASRGQLGRSVADWGGANAILHRGARHTETLAVELDLASERWVYRYVALLRFTEDDRLVFTNELCGFRSTSGTPAALGSLGTDHRESRLAGLPDAPAFGGGGGSGAGMPDGSGFGGGGGSGVGMPDGSGYGDGRDDAREVVRRWFGGLARYHFHDTSGTSPMRINARRVDDRTVRSDGGNLAAYLYGLRGSTEHDDRAAWDLLMHRLRHTAPFIRDLVPEPVGRDHVRLDWIDSRGDRYGVHQLSDGTLRALALFAALGQPIARRPRFITIDEPELGLHPSALHSVCELIRSVAPTTQVLMATQSPGLLDQFEPADVIVVEAHEEGSVFRRLDPLALSGWLDEYTLSDLFEKNVLGGRP